MSRCRNHCGGPSIHAQLTLPLSEEERFSSAAAPEVPLPAGPCNRPPSSARSSRLDAARSPLSALAPRFGIRSLPHLPPTRVVLSSPSLSQRGGGRDGRTIDLRLPSDAPERWDHMPSAASLLASPPPAPASPPDRPGSHALPSLRDVSLSEPHCIARAPPPSAAPGSSSIRTPGRRGRRGGRIASSASSPASSLRRRTRSLRACGGGGGAGVASRAPYLAPSGERRKRTDPRAKALRKC